MPKKERDPEILELRRGRIPGHVAIIMDGNGRWAKRRLLPRIEGHRAGTRSVRRSLETALSLGIPCLTLYTFSLENWERPADEIRELMIMLRLHLLKEKKSMQEKGIRLLAIGDRGLLPADVRETLERIEGETAGGTALTLVLALSYGSRQEIADAAVSIARETARGELSSGEVDEAEFERHLLTAGLPPVDLLVRTSGEHRLSNFLLWQAVGAHLHFTSTLWPDFDRRAFCRAVRAYQSSLGGEG